MRLELALDWGKGRGIRGGDGDLDGVGGSAVAADDDQLGLLRGGQGELGQVQTHAQVVPTDDLGFHFQAAQVDENLAGLGSQSLAGENHFLACRSRVGFDLEGGRIDGEDVGLRELGAVVDAVGVVEFSVGVDEHLQGREGSRFAVCVASHLGDLERQTDIDRLRIARVDRGDADAGLREPGLHVAVGRCEQGHIEGVGDRLA